MAVPGTGREQGPYLTEWGDELPPPELAPRELPDSRPPYPGLPLPTGEAGECRTGLLFVHQNNLEPTVRFLMEEGATAIPFWDGTIGLDYQVPTGDFLSVVETPTDEREWLLRTDTGSVREALGAHLRGEA